MKKLLDWENAVPLHTLPLTGDYQEPSLLDLESVIEYASQMLPAEGPITGFSFLNPLHAFEHLPFDEGVKIGHSLFGGQPYRSEEAYCAEVERGRIRAVDLQAILEADLGRRGWELICGLCSRSALRLAMLRHPILTGTSHELGWFMEESEALSKFRVEISPLLRQQISSDTSRWVLRDLVNQGADDGGYRRPGPDDPRRQHVLWSLFEHFDDTTIDQWSEATWEAFSLRALWKICTEGVRGVERNHSMPSLKVRPRDVLFEATGIDSDPLVHDMLIRYCAAFTDQGLAHWEIPHRGLGFFKSFLKLYRIPFGSPDRWLAGLADELARLDDAGVSAMESIRESLDMLGVSKGEWEDFFPATMLALRGWASMIRQMAVRADRFPVSAPLNTLTDYMAVRLILERFALTYVAREEFHYRGPLQNLRAEVQARRKPQAAPAIDQRSFHLFQVAQLLGWCPATLQALTKAQWTMLVAEIEAFPSLERRRIFHAAFEHRFRVRALDAVGIQAKQETRRIANPLFQASFCIDAREESFRRHLEETCPRVETFAAAGFYTIPIYFRGVADAHFNPLCPIVLMPTHWVVEEPVYSLQETHRFRAKARKVVGTASRGFQIGSQTFALGALFSAGLGVLASIPLVARVLFPRLTASIEQTAHGMIDPPPVTRLVIERTAPKPGPAEEQIGFTLDEMANFGERVLRDIGLTSGFARLFFVLGHKTSCVNNPHKSAYDCGACTGPGGPNARALAMFLNDRRIRQTLAQRGLVIPDDTYFIGGVHNTATDSITFFDLDQLPRTHLKDVEAAREIFEKACELNAHERCRRFYSAPLNLSLSDARIHAENRAEDLAQTRPEFGNATNALCVVGRRSRTLGLFMDRRSFLHSYDPTQDDANGFILARILSAVIPVCEGINLQYFFSNMDPARFGAGSKLPHNVTSLLGVMDGAASDLRQGLPWQGVEIHEPLRILFVIETTPEIMLKIIDGNKTISRIIRNGWAQLAVLDPHSNEIKLFQNGEFQIYHPETTTLPQTGSSVDWYRGSRVFMDFAQVKA